jgi:hypothetical protein
MTQSNNELFLETWQDLVRRWLRRLPVDDRPTMPLDDLLDAGQKRAADLRGISRIRAPRVLATQREYEAFWNVRERWDALEGALGVHGWKVRLMPGRLDPSTAPMQAQERGERNLAMIYGDDLDDMYEALQKGNVSYPVVPADFAVLELADELYRILALKIGKPPREPWVDEIARPLFQQEVLGTPFNPLAIRLSSKVSLAPRHDPRRIVEAEEDE